MESFSAAVHTLTHCPGASFCYLLSYLVGRRLVRHYLPERAAQVSGACTEARKEGTRTNKNVRDEYNGIMSSQRVFFYRVLG